MLTLLKNLSAVRAATASLLLSPAHHNSLHSAADIASTLNIDTNIKHNASITKKVDTSILLRACGRDDPEFVLEYEAFFGWDSGGDILYIRRLMRTAHQ